MDRSGDALFACVMVQLMKAHRREFKYLPSNPDPSDYLVCSTPSEYPLGRLP
jgi:hypothetical protein